MAFVPDPGEITIDDQPDAVDDHVYLKAIALRPANPAPSKLTWTRCWILITGNFLGRMASGRSWSWRHQAEEIQAAAWTTQVLTGLDKKFPDFSQSIALISSVSGGSTGTLYYLGLRGLRKPADMPRVSLINEHRSKRICDMAEQSCLEASGWGLAFPDLFQTIAPGCTPRFVDRGYALESVWWNRMGRNQQDRLAMSDVTLRDLVPLVKGGLAPAVIFNATCVETGQRVSFSPIRLNMSTDPSARDGGPSYVAQPIDFLSWYGESLKDPKEVDLRLSTATRLSATFSYVTPVARPFLDARHWKDDQPDDKQYLHYCDGGYSDNAGLVTVIKMVHDLIKHYYKRLPARPNFDRILVVRIEPFPPDEGDLRNANKQGFESAFFGPSLALNSARVSTRAERGELEMTLLQEMSNPKAEPYRFVTHAQWYLTRQVLQSKDADPAFSKAISAIADNLNSSLREAREQTLSRDPKKSSADLQGKLADPIRQIKQLQKDKQDKPHLVYGLTSCLENLESAQQVLDSQKNADPLKLPIPVHSITFHFGTGGGSKPNLQPQQTGTGTPYPPLSWTLSRKQKAAIEKTWEKVWAQESLDSEILNPIFADDTLPKELGKFFGK